MLPPGAFLQATAAGEAALAALVLEHCGAARSVADLFAGVGPFALRLAERAKVMAAEQDQEAVAALQEAAKTPRLKPIAAARRDLFARPFVAKELARLDAVIFNPPRQGAEAQARELAASPVPILVAVSCNPITFARDAGILAAGGYRLTRVTPVDQFLYSAHVELVARFERVGWVEKSCDTRGRARIAREDEGVNAARLAHPTILQQQPHSPQRSRHMRSPMVQEIRGALAAAGMTRGSGVRPAISSTSLLRVAPLN